MSNTKTNLCTKCNTPNGNNAQFCMSCKNPLTEEAKKKIRLSNRASLRRISANEKNNTNEKINCPNCGSDTNANKKFCSKCGSEVYKAVEIQKILDNQLELDLQIISEDSHLIDLEKMISLDSTSNGTSNANEKKKVKNCTSCHFANIPTARFCRKCGFTFTGSVILGKKTGKSSIKKPSSTTEEKSPTKDNPTSESKEKPVNEKRRSNRDLSNRNSNRTSNRNSNRTSNRDLNKERTSNRDLNNSNERIHIIDKTDLPTPMKKDTVRVSRDSTDKSEKIQCKKCTKMMSITAKFCVQCGESNLSRLSQSKESKPETKTITELKTEAQPTTPTSIEKGKSPPPTRPLKKYVSEQTIKLDETTRLCDNCNSVNKIGRKFCTQCGSTITGKISTPPIDRITSNGEKKGDIVKTTPPPEKKVIKKELVDSPHPGAKKIVKTVTKKIFLKKHQSTNFIVQPGDSKDDLSVPVGRSNSSPFIIKDTTEVTQEKTTPENAIPTIVRNRTGTSSPHVLNPPPLTKEPPPERGILKRSISLSKVNPNSIGSNRSEAPESPLLRKVIKKVVIRKSSDKEGSLSLPSPIDTKKEKEKLEKERIEKEKIENEKKEKELIEKEKVKKEQEKLERERQDKERIEKERLEKERLEKERIEKERIEKEKERIEQERLEKERQELERIEKERERLRQERLEKERLEKERLEKERLEKERLELEKIENERLERERLEKERIEKERLELKKLKQER
eukprot:TRINITY_DN3986_c0_g1_i2.p1 TRINITY_DN3986_c0_g1~~TRINITY_DN3986_c0_g1_i2.p1  ORF type:complete len:738 (+),score=276.56 TRINITY_DN3986_c0_g1_i2:93-2306(+)